MDARLPSWRLVEAALWIGVLLGLGAILTLAKEVLVPLALATLLSFALSPIVRALQKIGAPRALGAVVALALFMGFIGVWVWFVSGQVTDLADKLPAYRHNIHEKFEGLTHRFSAGGRSSGLLAMLDDALRDIAPAEGPGTEANAPQRVVVVDNSPFARISVWSSFASPVLSPIAQFFIVLVFTAFLLASREDLRNRLIKLIGPKDIYRTTQAIDDAGRRIGRMLFAQVVMNGTFGLIIALALWRIGVPNPALWGALAAIARFVPYLGVVIGVIPPLVVAFAFDPGWTPFLLTLALFAAAEGVTGQLIEPIVYGHSSGLSPTAVVLAASLWAYLWGAIGLVLATPLTTCLVVLGRHAPGLGFLEILLGDEAPLSAQEQFYQRMLAGDPREAAQQARAYIRRDAIADYYDEIALEALRRAQIDIARGDLDDGRLAALTKTTTQLVNRLGAAGGAERLRSLARRLGRLRAGGRAAALAQAGQGELLRARRGVAVLHGKHPLDPLAAAMLTDSLIRRGLPSRIVSLDEARTATAAEYASVGLVCLCYIEPLTVAHLRAAAMEARRRCPQAKVLICIWRDPADVSFKGQERKLRCDAIVTGISAAGDAALALTGANATPWTLAMTRWTDEREAA
jgi:predicted PurR-regulated permease PerM